MKNRYRRLIALIIAGSALLTPFVFSVQQAQMQGIVADTSFYRLWEHSDRIVEIAPGSRSWLWGPAAGAIKNERYDQAPGGARVVQYFDKARMEVNNPSGDRNSDWFVTTGLLVVEMTSGSVQTGDNSFVAHEPANIPVAGDANDPNAPTYVSFRPVASITGNSSRTDSHIGAAVVSTINRAGQVGVDQSKTGDPNAVVVAYSDIFGHNIPRSIWEFMNQGGPVLDNGTINYVKPVTNWIFTMGYPITEAYWAKVNAGGQPIDVLIQLFQRRALVYIPSYQAPWNVQMANVGAQYYQWMYNEPLPPAQNTPAATATTAATNTPLPPTKTTAPTNTAVPATPTTIPSTATIVPPTATVAAPTATAPEATATATTVAPTATAAAATPTIQPGVIPPAVDGSVNPKQGAAGTIFTFQINNFRPVEGVTAVFTDPNGRTFDMGLNRVTTQSGEISGLTIDSTGFADGLWKITFTGSASKHQSIVYFQVGFPPTATPTQAAAQPTATNTPLPPAQPSATGIAVKPTATTVPGSSLAVNPTSGSRTTSFTFSGGGFNPNEKVDYWFIDSSNRYWYPSPGRYLTASSGGTIGFTVVPNDAFYDVPTGAWTFHVLAQTSGRGSDVTFTIK